MAPPQIPVPALVRALLELDRQHGTGVLELELEGVVTLVYVADGVPVFAEEGTLGETLGRVLLQQERLTSRQYAAVIERMTSSVMGSEQLRFGEVAIALGFLSADDVEQALRAQVSAKIARCLQRDDVAFTFRDDPEAVAEVAHFPCSVSEVVWAGVRRFYDPQRCEAVWRGHEQAYPELADEPRALATALHLSVDECQYLSLLDGTRELTRTIQAAAVDVVRAAQLLTALLLLGAIELHTEALEPPSRRAAGPAPRPSRAPIRREPSLRAPAASQVRQKNSPELRQARLEAERRFQRGKEHLHLEEYAAALAEFLAALHSYPTATEYVLYAEWSRFHTLSHPGDRLLKRRELRGVAVRALKQDHALSFAHYILAELALLDGDLTGARKAAELALRFEPKQPETLRFIQRLVRKK